MADLGLGVPAIGWHAARDRFAEFGGLLAMIAATMGKIAHEVILLQKSEVMELEEPHHHGKVGSSTMPHKRNPMMCEGIMAQARLARALQAALLESMGTAEHERDWSAVHAEWAAVPEISLLAGASVAQTLDVIRGLIVYPDNMRRNVDALHGLILSEAVMLKLGESVGRQVAHDIVYEAAMAAFEQRRPLRDLLLADERVMAASVSRPRSMTCCDRRRTPGWRGCSWIALRKLSTDEITGRLEFADCNSVQLPSAICYSLSAICPGGTMLIAPWHFSFTVSDIEQSILFYRDVLGMELMHRQEQANEYTRKFVGYPDAHLKVAQFRIAGLPTARSGHVLELVEYVAPQGQKVDTQTKNTGTAHLAFQVDDVWAEYERMLALGVRFRSEPIAIAAGINKGGFTCYFLDPDDITLEIIQAPPAPGVPSVA